MEVVVFGKHVEVSARLREFTEEKVERISKFARDVRRVEVDYSEIRNPRVAENQTCEILVHLTGHLVKGTASASDPHAALDLALDKVERQLRKLHTRRTRKRSSRRDGGRGRAAMGSNGEGLEGVLDPIESVTATSVAEATSEPTIVKTKQFIVKPMSPEEAALQMDMLGHDFFLFNSSETGRAAVIYRRRDGDLGLIETG